MYNAKFLRSSSHVSQCPQDELPEFAFIGRSNVGKSSLINMLCNKPIAKVSGTPGKTRLINHFSINEQWYLVDLPGYGYAKASKKTGGELSEIIFSYLTQRKQLTQLFLLIDIRHQPLQKDLEFIDYLGEHQIPFLIIFTKADKLSVTACNRQIDIYKKTLLESWEELPRMMISSSEKKIGKSEILSYIQEILLNLNS